MLSKEPSITSRGLLSLNLATFLGCPLEATALFTECPKKYGLQRRGELCPLQMYSCHLGVKHGSQRYKFLALISCFQGCGCGYWGPYGSVQA